MKELLSDLRENAIAIHQHGQRAENTINNMMQLARMENHSLQFTDLNALLDEAVALAYHSKRVLNFEFMATIDKEYDSNITQLECFPTELSRALINLIDNAFCTVQKKQLRMGQEFTPTLSIKTCKQDNAVEIRIRDNGTGIPLEDQNKLFESFFTTKPTGEGTGLGLSMTHEIIVGQHRGKLALETTPGVYTEFIVTLPTIVH
jgi:signal transduction histidine kinase